MLLGALALGGCGLTPVYGPGRAARRGLFAFDAPQSEAGFLLLEALENRLGAPSAPRYQLKFSVGEAAAELLSGRYRLHGFANWQAFAGEQSIAGGRTQGFVNYSSGDEARSEAQERLAAFLAERITAQIWAQLP